MDDADVPDGRHDDQKAQDVEGALEAERADEFLDEVETVVRRSLRQQEHLQAPTSGETKVLLKHLPGVPYKI